MSERASAINKKLDQMRERDARETAKRLANIAEANRAAGQDELF